MDTLELTLKGSLGKDFTIKEGWKYNHLDPLTGIYGNMVKDISLNETKIGDKTYRNGNVYLSYSPNYESVKVQFSATKLLYGSSLFEYDIKDGHKLIEKLYETTQDAISIDFEKMKVYRYDDSVNILTADKTSNYIFACGESVMQKQGTFDKKLYEEETLSLSNSSLTIDCYDKVKKELQVKGNTYDKYAPMFKGLNVFRFEMQNKNPQGMRAKTRYGKKLLLTDVLSHEIQETSNRIRLETFENYFVPKGITKHEKNKRAIDMITKKRSRNVMVEWYMYQAMRSASPEEAKRIMKSIGMSRKHISEEVKKLKKYKTTDFNNETFIAELYEAIKNKALN